MKLPVGWNLPPSLGHRLGETLGRQRAIMEEDQLLLILHEPPRAAEKARHAVAYWRALPAANGEAEWKSSGGGGNIGALKAHFGAYGAALDDLESRLDKAGDARDCFSILEAISPLHRAATNGASALQAAREALPNAQDLISLRDLSSDVERRADLLHADARNALEFQIARQAEQQARFAQSAAISAHRFNLVAAIFLPITALASIFGMNLPNGLENSTGLFWLVFAFGSGAGAILAMLMKRQR